MFLYQQNKIFIFRPIDGEIRCIGQQIGLAKKVVSSNRLTILATIRNKVRARATTRVKARTKTGSGSGAIKKNL